MLHVAPIQWPAWHWHSTIETPRGHNNSNHNNSNNNNSNNNNSNNNDSNNNDRNHEATASTDSASRCDRSDRRLPRYWGLGPVAKPRKQFHFYFPFFFCLAHDHHPLPNLRCCFVWFCLVFFFVFTSPRFLSKIFFFVLKKAKKKREKNVLMKANYGSWPWRNWLKPFQTQLNPVKPDKTR